MVMAVYSKSGSCAITYIDFMNNTQYYQVVNHTYRCQNTVLCRIHTAWNEEEKVEMKYTYHL